MVEPKYQIKWTSQYKKDIKLAKKRHYKIEELQKVVFSLANGLPCGFIQKITFILPYNSLLYSQHLQLFFLSIRQNLFL